MKKIFPAITLIIMAGAVVVWGQESITPLTMDECVEMALSTHPSIKAAGMGRQAAVYQKRMAIASALFSVNAQYSHTWLDEQPTFSIPGQPDMTLSGSLPNPTPPPASIPVSFTVPGSPPRQLPAGEDQIDSFTLTATQPIFTGGAIWQAWRIAKLREYDATLQFNRVKMEIAYQTRQAFYSVLKAEKFVEVSGQALKMAEKLRSRAADFYDVGMIPKNQLLEAEVGVAERKQGLTSAQSGLAIARSILNILIGKPRETELEVTGKLEMVPFELTMEQCLKTGMNNRPEALSARARAEMASRMVKIERSQWLPQVALVGTYKHEVGGFSSDEDILSLTMAATWDFWEWGKKYYNVKNSVEMASQAAQSVKLTEDRVSLEIMQAYFRLKEAESNVETARVGMASAVENLKVVEARFDQNMATSADMISAQTMLTRARTSEISALADYMTDRAALERAMGLMPGSHYDIAAPPESSPDTENETETHEEENEENP